MRARVTHAVASGRRVVLTVAVPMDRTATADDVARVLRDLGGYRCDVDVTAVAPVVEAVPVVAPVPITQSLDESIEKFRRAFKALSIPESTVKVTWDSDANPQWARLRMRLASGKSVDRRESARPGEVAEHCLARLTRYLAAGVRRVRKGEPVDVVFTATEAA